jgi:glycosyltransferase involved in cell wall biosynthesis
MLASGDMIRKYRMPIFGAIESWGLKLYRNLIVLSGAEAEKIKAVNPDAEISVIPNGVTLTKKPVTKTVKKHILFLGRIEIDQKGLDLLLEAYTKIAGRIKYPLIIAGSGEKSEKNKLDLMIEKSGLKNFVTIAGRVEGEEKEKLLAGAVFVVIPSRYETFSLTALEAMAAGTGIITFDIEGLKWIPETISVKASCFDVSELSSLILGLSTDERKLSLMGKAGKDYVRKFDWEQIADKYAKCILKTSVKQHG